MNEMTKAYTAIELVDYMKAHEEQFTRKYSAYSLRKKALACEIPALQHEVKGSNVSVCRNDKEKQRWAFLLEEVKLCLSLGGGRNVVKEIVKRRNYDNIISSF